MSAGQRVGADGLRAVVAAFAEALTEHREALNRLNVYPVPDGDTGTNMALTVRAVRDELDGAADTLEDVCRAISHGSLMGARGNSGVILSQILRALSSTIATAGGLDGASAATGLRAAAEAAYAAVLRPQEGTILTVARDAADAAVAALDGGRSELVDVAEAALDAAERSVARTPELLPVLAEAGVVDAGGRGYTLLLAALLHVVDGRPLPVSEDEPGPGAVVSHAAAATAAHDGGGDHRAGLADLRYEVMFLLDAPDGAMDGFKAAWGALGDSIVVVGGDGLWNCHIHTDDIGGSIEVAVDVGRPRRIKVTDLLAQVSELEEERWVRDHVAATSGPVAAVEPEPDGAAPVTAVVAVAVGDGVGRILRSLGVSAIVTGGQSMNPSTAELLAAAEAVGAPGVVVLPNNGNVVPVARQVDGQTDKHVRVVPTKGVVEGFAALMAFDPDADVDENAASMAAAACQVVTGEVTRAVRASSCPAGPIAEGDFLGIGRDGIAVVSPTLVDAATGLLGKLVDDDHEVLTLVVGDGATADDTERVAAWVASRFPDLVVEVHDGGQPLYPYLIGLE